MTNKSTKPSIVISGSFRKHLPAIGKLRDEFIQRGFEVLSPTSSKAVNPGEDFVFLTSDTEKDIKVLEQNHLSCIEQSDALYIYNPGGEIGLSVALELGWAHALGKPIFVKEETRDLTLRQFHTRIASPEDVKSHLHKANEPGLESIKPRSSLKTLQKYIHEVVIQRGFGDEQPRDILLLMMEEVGELAKVIRKLSGIKIDATKNNYALLEDELADVFIYLLDLAGTLEVDLFSAFYSKEQKNSKRSWL